MSLDGVLPVLKPVGFTSHDVVAKARRILRMKRIGHTGTLDPQVTGVLPLCIGRATKLVEYIQELPKEYEAVLRIGVSTDTEDMTGEIVSSVDSVTLTESQIRSAVGNFLGEISQVPPMYSAVKVDGKRLYELARQGEVVERKARQVFIYSIDILELKLDKQHPDIRFRVKCSKGTYIRTLCVDIGKALGYPAAMAELTRTSTGHISMDQCYTLDQIQKAQETGDISSLLIPVERMVSHMPRMVILDSRLKQALQGQKLPVSFVSGITGNERDVIAAFTEQEKLVGFYQLDPSVQRLVPVKIYSDQV
ncbi:tRNA pseudouridine(55) synthase TruB [Paenibacillus gansuensis]|uniref:tRNA pseudouridine synthase B n=1 Tax=Paenibacillus gansuensis TaxID=306542 RepID=A0ABW5PDP9_9BACL